MGGISVSSKQVLSSVRQGQSGWYQTKDWKDFDGCRWVEVEDWESKIKEMVLGDGKAIGIVQFIWCQQQPVGTIPIPNACNHW